MFHHRDGCRHAVHFYRDDADERETVAAYITSALRAGGHALLIARPPLQREVTLELHRQHVNAPFDAARGDFVCMDAAATLGLLSKDGKPDEAMFDSVIGSVLESLCREGRAITAYGEMVGILCERGQYAEAVRLEQMWNGMLTKRRASLLCGYSRELFRNPAIQSFYQQIQHEHTRVSGA